MCQDRRDGLVASPRPPPPGSARSLGGEIAAQRPPVGWAASPLPSASRPPAPLLAPPEGSPRLQVPPEAPNSPSLSGSAQRRPAAPRQPGCPSRRDTRTTSACGPGWACKCSGPGIHPHPGQREESFRWLLILCRFNWGGGV